MAQNIDISPGYDYTSLTPVSFLEELWERLWKAVATGNQRKISSARLSGLSPQLLKDIGIDQRQAFDETFNRFWEE
jgi:uncharacterized protein YjiS (DUF1127 family)